MQSRWLVIAAVSLPIASSARADPGVEAPASVPDWAIAARFPWDVAHADATTLIAVLGLGLDLDTRVTDHTTVGFSTEASLVLALESNGEPGQASPLARLRAGVDARWIFHDGTSLVVPHCGPAFEVPSRAWLGARAGFETLDQGATSGHFAELSIGWERLVGHVAIGPYLAVGIEDEPAAAYPVPDHPFPDPSPYAAPAMTSVADPQQSAYITLGMRIGGA